MRYKGLVQVPSTNGCSCFGSSYTCLFDLINWKYVCISVHRNLENVIHFLPCAVLQLFVDDFISSIFNLFYRSSYWAWLGWQCLSLSTGNGNLERGDHSTTALISKHKRKLSRWEVVYTFWISFIFSLKMLSPQFSTNAFGEWSLMGPRSHHFIRISQLCKCILKVSVCLENM